MPRRFKGIADELANALWWAGAFLAMVATAAAMILAGALWFIVDGWLS